jgi:Uncharacterised nucleotidyltransferase
MARDTSDPPALAADASEHGVDGLVWRALEHSAGPAAALRARLEARVRAAVARELVTQRELTSMLQSLSASGVQALVIKGSALAYAIYDEPWLRPRSDTDLLVSPDAVDVAAQALDAVGYRRSHVVTSGEFVSHQASFTRTDPTGLEHAIDLHWKIVNPQILANALSFEELWADAMPIDRLGPAARMPTIVGSLILAAVHRLAHHQDQDCLIWLYDLRLLAARLDAAGWDVLVQLATARQVAGLCLDGLRQARDQVGALLPERVELALASAAPFEPSHRYLEGRVTRGQVLANDLAALRSWRARLQLIREHAFPPTAFMRERYGVKSSLLLPALYIHRLLAGAYRWVRP